MSKIDVIKESVQFQQLIRENDSTSILNDEYLIPDTHPDVQEILSVDARTIVSNKEVLADKVMVEGKVEYTVLYIPREDGLCVNSVSYTEKFTNYLDLQDGEQKIICEVECKVEHIEARIMNERKIALEGVIDLDWKVYKSLEFDFVKDIEGTEGVEVLKKTESINRLVTSKEVDLVGKSTIRVGMDKPQISKVLNLSMMLHKKEVKLAEDKVYLGCYCKVNLLYLGEETKEVIALNDDVYISKDEELMGVLSNMLPNAIFEIKNSDLALEEDDLGEARIVNIEFLTKASVKVFSDEVIEIIKDAYSPVFPIEIKKSSYEVGVIKGSQVTENIIKDNIAIKEEELRPERIVCACGNIILMEKTASTDKVTVEGLIKTNVIYRAVSDEVGYTNISEDIPFTIALDIKGTKDGMKVVINTCLESMEASIEGNSIAIKANISVSGKLCYEISKEFISDVIEVEGEVKHKKASVTIYVVSKDDTLWSLAKKYNTTVKDIIKMNSLDEEEELKIGQKLIIPGRAKF